MQVAISLVISNKSLKSRLPVRCFSNQIVSIIKSTDNEVAELLSMCV